LFRPSGQEVRSHGIDLMRTDGLDQVASAAYESAARLIDTERFVEALTALHGSAAA
jgi:hypothetical protein